MGTWVLRLANDGQGPRLAVKDCIDVAGVPTTAGGPVVAEMAEPAERDAGVVASARGGGAGGVAGARRGVPGLKTADGRISVKGVYPLAPSLDTVGALGADVAAVELGMRLLEPGVTTAPAPAALVA